MLVLAGNGHPDASPGGGTKMLRVGVQGLAGLLADGRLRDFTELKDHDFTTFCRGETTAAGGGLIGPL
ncbi:hypothetical protein [Ornithinimicrobium sp. INDO-MA30-4]|uniref:RraA family protein n=1 Tax=Ornithinimicrobium sp. INDO-MA30-4 TaxID=2908651 RepID=UPI001F22B6EA|nr:hypothetical protein [Ornithinimicrobium sp. INDO-MA30-4]UJH70525.1 hypothetical protein L0A91_15950 [Ornithinimicrobium sp. INDO-MA30-4]